MPLHNNMGMKKTEALGGGTLGRIEVRTSLATEINSYLRMKICK